MDAMLKEAEEMKQREKVRKELEILLEEDVDESTEPIDDSRIISTTTELAIGKQGTERLKQVLARVGADLSKETSFRFFRQPGIEREFDVAWIEDVEWLSGFEGHSLWSG